MRDVQGPSVRLQGGHLVPRGHPDRAGTDRAAQSRDEPHESAAENSQGRSSNPDAAVPLVRLSGGSSDSEYFIYPRVELDF